MSSGAKSTNNKIIIAKTGKKKNQIIIALPTSLFFLSKSSELSWLAIVHFNAWVAFPSATEAKPRNFSIDFHIPK